MPNFIENLGMHTLTETEDGAMSFMATIAQEGKPIAGYYHCPYLNMHWGDAQFILRTEKNDTGDGYRVTGMDTHSAGRCVWKTRISGLPINPESADITQRKCALTRIEDGSGMAIVNIVNADVLPSFLEDDEITLQMVAFPVQIDYYADEDEYENSQSEDQDGEKWLLAKGAVFPNGLLHNRDPENKEADLHPEKDDYTLIHGTEKVAYRGVVDLGGEKYNAYIRTTIETQFGDLELIHTYNQVRKEQWKNIKTGSTVYGLFVLSGDAAIYEYEEGIVRDEEHNLRALRYTFVEGQAERLESIFDENARYTSESSGLEHAGKDAIIQRLKYVSTNREQSYLAQMAVITSVDEENGVADAPAFAVGKRCVVLSKEREDNYESIAFIDVNENGYITKLTISTDSRYHFRCDPKPERTNPYEDFSASEETVEPIAD